MISLHDWEINQIGSSFDEKSVYLNLSSPEKGGEFILCLFGVEHFIASGMMLQNVILDVLIFDKPESTDYFGYCCEMLNIGENFFDEYPGKKLLYIESSVGAEIASSFSSYKLGRK